MICVTLRCSDLSSNNGMRRITEYINYLILLKALIKEETSLYDSIETKILNSYTIQEAAQNMVFAARLTQQGHSIQNINNIITLIMFYGQNCRPDSFPPTVQKFTVITVV